MSTEAQSPQEVSGQSAFWILASLAAAAVVLPSTSRRMSGRDLFGGNIDLVRCIPGVSLFDSICDTILLCLSTYRVLRAPKPVQRARRALPKVSVVAAKLMLSIFTVFPQIIKAISLKGVPATQFCAFVFFYATTTRLLIDLCGLEPEEPFTPQKKEITLWTSLIVLSVKFQLSDTFYRICTWSSLLIIWMLYVVSRWRFDITASPHIIPVRAFWLFITALAAARKPRKHEDRQSESQAKIPPPPAASDKLVQAAGSMICVILLSILVAKALNLMGRLFALPIETPETPETLTEEGECPTDDSQQGVDAEKDEEKPPVEPEGGRLGRLGGIVDRWLVRFLLMDTTADISITLTVFNLITTIIYYLVYFDGTGTVNPGWTSVLG
ncbi:hypothetical protein FCULG_00005130 [Fusarium culmorum]|uniref:Uncharacterized protein n=1 Tax=Fusarium culmorum TaxID=5516 RepID=A0A2T4HB00_FUSCU|nr:hypothetical protein FCULG_00005130 [Fusarium culmorum]